MDIMDGRNLAWIVLLLGKCTAVLGATNLACTSAYPTPQSPVTCECWQTSRNDIQWFKEGTFISSCSAKNDICSPTPSRYIFKIADTASVSYYNLTITSYDYTDCGLYSCEDFSTTPDIDHFSLSIFDFTASSSTPIAEPSSNHSNGNISLTTGCFINKTEVMENIQWYKVAKDVPTAYSPGFSITEDSASCKQCGGEQASKLTIQFYHEEATGDDVEEVRFRITLFHNRNKYDVLNMTTNNYYYVKDDDQPKTTTNATLTRPISTTSLVASLSSRTNWSEVGSIATTETVIINITTNATDNSVNTQNDLTSLFVYTVLGAAVLGAVVVFIYLIIICRNKHLQRDKN